MRGEADSSWPLRAAASPELTEDSFGFSEAAGVSSESGLIYSEAARKLEIRRREGLQVFLSGVGAETSLSDLSESLRFEGLSSAEVVGATIQARFESLEAAALFEKEFRGAALLEDGPYGTEVRRIGPARLELPTRHGSHALQLVLADESNHWQLLIGGHVDVLFRIDTTHAEQLRDVETIEIRKRPTTHVISILFNPDRVGHSVRRRVQRLVVESRIASECSAEKACSVGLPGQENLRYQQEGDFSGPSEPFTLGFFEGNRKDELEARGLAALVWRRSGLEVELESMSFEDLTNRIPSADFDAVFVPTRISAAEFYRSFEQFSSLGFSASGAAFSVKNAVREEAWAELANHFANNAFVVPLSPDETFAAVADGWCFGDNPDGSRRWVATVERCPSRGRGRSE